MTVAQTNIHLVKDEYPFRNTAPALCLDAELKRLAKERSAPIGTIVSEIANSLNVSDRQINYYRQGKTEIPADKIKSLCKSFGSIALGNAWLSTFEAATGEMESFDLIRFTAQMVRNILQGGDKYMAAFDDGEIDGGELRELQEATAAIQRDANRLQEIAEAAYNRRRAA